MQRIVFLFVANSYLNCICFVADVDVDKPDEKSIMTYVSQFFKAFPEAGTKVNDES